MQIRWTTAAADDLAGIVEQIRKDNPAAALRVARRIYEGIATLRRSPHRGRVGLSQNTRELVFAPWPYIAVFEIEATKCMFCEFRAAARDWP